MKSFLKCVAFTLLVGILLYGLSAFAASNDSAFTKAREVMTTTFKNVRMLVYIFGAFALIVVAVGAIMGKLDFKKVAFLAAGLAIVASADLIVRYAISGDPKDESGSIGRSDFDLK